MSKLISLMISSTGLSRSDLQTVIASAPSRYKTFTIPKRSGGERIISQPARELKALQRVLIEHVLSALPVHEAATAYRPGTSIRRNAEAHLHNGPILKLDFKDFFPSIRASDWTKYCFSRRVFEEDEDIQISKKILFQNLKGKSELRLAIGAPSSPCLSNIILYDFDRAIAESVAKDKVTYTRYADDMTFSAPRTGHLVNVESFVSETIKRIQSPKLQINESKTKLATLKYKRQITGLILTNQSTISIGHEKKRTISAALHHYKLGKLGPTEATKLAGMLAFVNDVEPDFLTRLRNKYGIETIKKLKLERKLKPEEQIQSDLRQN